MSVLYLHVSRFYGSVEPRFARVEYSWFEVDEHGDDTGNQVLYAPDPEPNDPEPNDPEPNDPEPGKGQAAPPEGCVLRVLFVPEGGGAVCPAPDTLWCPAVDFDALTDPL